MQLVQLLQLVILQGRAQVAVRPASCDDGYDDDDDQRH